MKIVDIQLISLANIPLPSEIRPAWAPGIVQTHGNTTIVKVLTDDGVIGYGTGGPLYLMRDAIKPYLIGKDPFDTEQHIVTIRNAGGGWGLEIALWDVIGKACGWPLYKIWGGARDKIKAYASTMEVGIPEQRAEDALAFLQEGFKAIKLRIHNWDMKDDIALVEAVRRAVGDRMEIMVDANQAQSPGTVTAAPGPVWTYERALATALELEQLGVVWLEEPLARYNFSGLARLCDAVSIYIAGGENNRGLHEFKQIVEQGVYDILIPECLTSEGISQLKKVAAIAELSYRQCVPHHGGGGIGTMAGVHFSCAVPNSPYVELFRNKPGVLPSPAQWVITEPIMPDADGWVRPSDGPGLGIYIDEEMVKKYGKIIG